ncbi:MAG: sucrose phosphorylase [Propionibacteriaceae bacterium]|jgi:glycosidase|nr:sucrose phosphorylase [Propionibacteriaceae bacterium]
MNIDELLDGFTFDSDRPHGGFDQAGPQLICYADRLAGSIAGVKELLDGPLARAFDGVHLLPFFTPFDGADAGFDPTDHTSVDPRLGSWDDVRALSRKPDGTKRSVMADVIVNHMSADAPQFLDVVERGDESPTAGMFLTLSSIYPDGATEEDLARIYRPRPGLPFTPMTLGGHKRLVWTTFTAQQVDLDIRDDATWDYLAEVITNLTEAGVDYLRLDAVGYVGKEAGTDCFMTESASDFIERLRAFAHERGAEILVEVHGHHSQQIDIADQSDWVYDFALPPLILHALTTGDLEPLDHWLDIRPEYLFTVLDTHDGIGVIDVGPAGGGTPGGDDVEAADTVIDDVPSADDADDIPEHETHLTVEDRIPGVLTFGGGVSVILDDDGLDEEMWDDEVWDDVTIDRHSGLLEPEQIDALVETIHRNSGETSRAATGAAASNLDLYQVNCTFYDALGGDDRRYLLARLIQLFLPGAPQVYYVGLLAGHNDMDLLARTGVGRDVNRHHYTPDEVTENLERPVVQAQLAALRLRREHPGFRASSVSTKPTADGMIITWGDTEEFEGIINHRVELRFTALTAEFAVSASNAAGEMEVVLTHADVDPT